MPETPPATSPPPAHPPEVEEFTWLVSNFVTDVAGVQHALVISSDGVVLTASREVPTQHADQLAAIVSGMHSLAQGTARMFHQGDPEELILRMEHGHLVVMGISGGSSLAVLTARGADTKVVSYQMTKLVESAGHRLTSEVRAALTHTSPGHAP